MDYAAIANVKRHASWLDFHAITAPCDRIVLFTTKSAEPLDHFAFQPDDVLLFGRESAGVPEEVHEAADARVCIPLVIGARSLNVVTAAAMALGEALRQTNGFPNPLRTG